MTVSSLVRKAGPFAGNGIATTFPFSFKIFTKADIKVLLVNPAGVSTELTLDSDYSVQLNADQDNNPGGWITYPKTGDPMPTGYELVGLGQLPNDQETDLTNTGGFYPQTIEDMSDRSTIQIQQLAEVVSRAIVLNETETTSPVLPPPLARSNTVLAFGPDGAVTVMPMPSSLGAGDMRLEIWNAGAGYTAGISTKVILSRPYGTKANLGAVIMQGVPQDPDTYDIQNDDELTFNVPIPAWVNKIWCDGGTTATVLTPGDNSVGDAQLIWGNVLIRRVGSVAAMQSLNVSKYQAAETTGYYAGGSGAGRYYYDSTVPAANADGGLKIASLTGIGCWVRIDTDDMDVMDWGAKADGTDCFPIVVKMLAALPFTRGEIRFPVTAGQFFMSDFPDLSNSIGVHIVGKGGATAGAQAATTILVGKTGAFNFINAPGSTGLLVKGIQFVTTSPAFTGFIVAFGSSPSNAAFGRVEDCSFFAQNVARWQARGIDFDKTIECGAYRCVFGNINYAIRGRTASSFSNVITIEECQFGGTLNIPIQGGGQAWRVIGPTFEGYTNGGAATAALAGAIVTLPTTGFDGLEISGVWAGDVNTPGGTWFSLCGGGINFAGGNYIGGSAGSEAIALNAVDGFGIEGTTFDTFTTAIDFTNAICRNVKFGGGVTYRNVTNRLGSPVNWLGYTGPVFFDELPNGKLVIRGQATLNGGGTAPANWSAVAILATVETFRFAFSSAPGSVNRVWPTSITTTSAVLNADGSGAASIYWEFVGTSG